MLQRSQKRICAVSNVEVAATLEVFSFSAVSNEDGAAILWHPQNMKMRPDSEIHPHPGGPHIAVAVISKALENANRVVLLSRWRKVNFQQSQVNKFEAIP